VNDVTWYVFGLMLTGIGLVLSYRAYQKNGIAAGARGAAWSLLPVAAALTGTLELAGDLTEDIGRWATHLARLAHLQLVEPFGCPFGRGLGDVQPQRLARAWLRNRSAHVATVPRSDRVHNPSCDTLTNAPFWSRISADPPRSVAVRSGSA